MPLLHLFLLLLSLLRLSGAPSGSGEGDPPAGDGDGETGKAGKSEAKDDLETADLEKLREAIRRERREKRELEKEVKPLRAYKETREQAEMSEADKVKDAQAKLEAWDQELTAKERRLAVRDGLTEAATAAKLRLNRDVTTDDLLRYLPLDELEWDDAAGKVKNLTPLLTSLAKSKPFLFDQRKRDGSADGGETSTQEKPTFNTPLERLSSAYANKR